MAKPRSATPALRALEAAGVHHRVHEYLHDPRATSYWLEAAAALGVLYDEGPGGAFFHCYTATFVDRFFFEIVQRQGAYKGFGASNAPVRMSAQARQG